jgi:ABC-2 type transport system permease protein
MYAKRVVIDLFSGLLLPISFYPLWAQKAMVFLPFQAISYIPSMIFSEGIQGSKLYEALLFQVMWAIILIIPIVLMWKTARKRLIVQGG